jgi:hypothetical protein
MFPTKSVQACTFTLEFALYLRLICHLLFETESAQIYGVKSLEWTKLCAAALTTRPRRVRYLLFTRALLSGAKSVIHKSCQYYCTDSDLEACNEHLIIPYVDCTGITCSYTLQYGQIA